jgi:glycosyltransferase involved in cell wall biosynthesis
VKLLINKNSGIPLTENPVNVISFVTLKQWAKTKVFIKKLFLFRTTELYVYSLSTVTRPFLTYTVVRLLSKRDSFAKDQKGNTLKINLSFLLFRLAHYIVDLLLLPLILFYVNYLVKAASYRSNYTNDTRASTRRPIYLRTDFWFGVKSGGSVAHISGVLNSLYKKYNAIHFITTDTIPLVRTDIDTLILKPSVRFWDFSEVPLIFSNVTLFKQIFKAINYQPSFIYQRYSLYSFLGLRLANLYRCPLILEFNGSEVWISQNWGTSKLAYKKLAHKIELLNLYAANFIIVVSKPLKDELIERGIPSQKILVAPNGVDLNMYSPSISGGQLRSDLHIADKIVVGFIGTFGPWHGAQNLVAAFADILLRFPDLSNRIHLLMIGEGVLKESCEYISSDRLIQEHVTFTGLIGQEIAPQYLAACDILVCPHVPNPDGTPFFGSPTKLFEYLSMGKAIIASDLDQLSDLLVHEKTAILVEPGSTHSLANAIRRLVLDSDLRESLGKNSRDFAENNCSWDIHTNSILKFISNV